MAQDKTSKSSHTRYIKMICFLLFSYYSFQLGSWSPNQLRVLLCSWFLSWEDLKTPWGWDPCLRCFPQKAVCSRLDSRCSMETCISKPAWMASLLSSFSSLSMTYKRWWDSIKCFSILLWLFPDLKTRNWQEWNWRRKVFLNIHWPWRREWQLTPAFLPWEFDGQRNLVGDSSWGGKELDTIEWLTHAQHTLV